MTFGGGSDIYVEDNFSSDSSSMCISYGKNEGITNRHFLTGNTENEYFLPTEVEVYQVIKL